VALLSIPYFRTLSLYKKGGVESANASSTNKILTTQSDWDLGSKTNTLTTNGTLSISDVASGSSLDLTQGVTITSSADTAGKENLVDNNENTHWNYCACCAVSGGCGNSCSIDWQPLTHYWWQVDLGTSQPISSVMYRRFSANWAYYPSSYYSVDGTTFTLFPQNPLSAPVSVRYIKIDTFTGSQPSGCVANLSDIKIIGPATATHTSAADQITNANLYQWQTFTPTYSKPTNTDVSFRFKTSTDGASWGSWTASQTPASGSHLDISSLVTSKTGSPGSETFYKYIQVETTLTSTDGVSTPTLSDYTIDYHTNVKPNKPTAQTAVIGN
jgi:hypothetical protein